MKPKISIIIPCYNEQNKIKSAIDQVKETFANKKYELIFVDDGSTDDTLNTLKLYRQEYITYHKNIGKGYAVRRGLLRAKADTILILDCDMSVKPDEYIDICYVESYKRRIAFIGNRVQYGKQSIFRRFVGWGFKTIVKQLFEWDYNDSQCPFKVLHNIPKEVFMELSIEGFAYDVELINLLREHKIKIKEIKVQYIDDKDSRVTFKKAQRMLLDIIRIKIKK